jgi:Flp pilus assembly pilin Flp
MYSSMYPRLFSELRAETGQTMAEYAVVLGVITIAVVVTLKLLSTGIKGVLTNVIDALQSRDPRRAARYVVGSPALNSGHCHADMWATSRRWEADGCRSRSRLAWRRVGTTP